MANVTSYRRIKQVTARPETTRRRRASNYDCKSSNIRVYSRGMCLEQRKTMATETLWGFFFKNVRCTLHHCFKRFFGVHGNVSYVCNTHVYKGCQLKGMT